MGAVVVLAASGCDSSPTPTFPEFDDRRLFTDHREFDVRFESGDAVLSGTIYLPRGDGPFPAVAVNPGSSWTTRATWEESRLFVEAFSAAVLSYDKRGHGQSTGACCSSDANLLFALLGEDLAAAARTLRDVELIDATRIGVFGSSQGGWIVPLAANDARDVISYTVVTVGGAVSTGQENRYDLLTGYDVCERSELPMDEIIAELRADGPSDFDPRPSLEELTQPGIWLYGGNDMSHPTLLAVDLLEEIGEGQGTDWTIEVFPTANHDLIDGGEICQTEGPLVDVIAPLGEWMERVFNM